MDPANHTWLLGRESLAAEGERRRRDVERAEDPTETRRESSRVWESRRKKERKNRRAGWFPVDRAPTRSRPDEDVRCCATWFVDRPSISTFDSIAADYREREGHGFRFSHRRVRFSAGICRCSWRCEDRSFCQTGWVFSWSLCYYWGECVVQMWETADSCFVCLFFLLEFVLILRENVNISVRYLQCYEDVVLNDSNLYLDLFANEDWTSDINLRNED